jgi:regulator of sigma E protease
MLQTLFNILLIILGFGLLIFIHELGHFVAAKWAGIRAEAFAIGMGPVMVAWRKGIGLRFGSTAPDYEKRVREHLEREREAQISAKEKVKGLDPEKSDLPRAEFYRIGDRLGLGETEYSLRWLPIGGFVKMLGQEDANPNATSDDPRSYNMRPISKRMVVVSAGVIMNLILAVILFIVAFMIGVRFEAPVVGDVAPSLPAARAVASNAAALGVTAIGLQPGDKVLSIDGEQAKTFANLQIASAMSRPGRPLELAVERAGVSEPLAFSITPEKDPGTGLLSIGVAPGASTTLYADKGELAQMQTALLERTGLKAAGVEPGMTLAEIDGEAITAFGQIAVAARRSQGRALQTRWTASARGNGESPRTIEASLATQPDFEEYLHRELSPDEGLLGLTPLMRVKRVADDSPNAGRILNGDVIVRLAGVWYPRMSQVYHALQQHKKQNVEVVMLRDGKHVTLTCQVNGDGQLMFQPEPALDVMISAQPVLNYARYRRDQGGQIEDVKTPAARSGLFTTGGTVILEVAGTPVATWGDMRTALMNATRQAITGDGVSAQGEGAAEVQMLVAHPTPRAPQDRVTLRLTPEEVKSLHALSWHVDLPSYIFEPIYTLRQGNAIQAVAMGFEETHKMVMMTYLTIDRLIRRSVGVDQLRGPVGIVHIGSKVADRGFTYLIFFLAMISVNLAVINFLPLPIVDGGLFLFLLYEKFKGRPPSIAFQNAATVVGLMIIGTLFVVTFYNDVVRLFS